MKLPKMKEAGVKPIFAKDNQTLIDAINKKLIEE